MTRARLALTVAVVVALVGGCDRGPSEPRFEQLETPAPPGSRFPSVAVLEDRLFLSWIEGEEPAASVHVAVADGRDWGEPETIASGRELFVNWADFPSLSVDQSGTVAAQWLVRAGGPSWAYGIRFAVRDTDGLWSSPGIPHGEDHAGEHGFVSMVSGAAGRFDLIWLDGRAMKDNGPMELRTSRWAGGGFAPQRVLDRDVCTCCQTDMAAHGAERFVVYRDHTPGEIRDISYVRFDGATWSAPSSFHDDGWQIAACPVNGPAAAAHGAALAVAWFTQARDEPRVWARASDDFGRTFGDAVRIDDMDPIGRVDAAMLADGAYVVAWLERDGDDALINVRRVIDGEAGPVHPLGRSAAHRGSGFPRMATDGESTWIAWTETSRPPRVRLTRVRW